VGPRSTKLVQPNGRERKVAENPVCPDQGDHGSADCELSQFSHVPGVDLFHTSARKLFRPLGVIVRRLPLTYSGLRTDPQADPQDPLGTHRGTGGSRHPTASRSSMTALNFARPLCSNRDRPGWPQPTRPWQNSCTATPSGRKRWKKPSLAFSKRHPRGSHLGSVPISLPFLNIALPVFAWRVCANDSCSFCSFDWPLSGVVDRLFGFEGSRVGCYGIQARRDLRP